ncbi:LysM peptidoglycan-binding domain-containing protein [Limosilactobacillus sp. BG-MG3-A]|uniref:LysM peptidoglycan-binding domain-containing protein n=1 Tax=Limosilactobacillus agrestis TaxID=2759748 RepID=A0A7W3YLA0_9LACO|nr:C40 family peptidase [Limosilactobacillus agrestis]MBB1095280.1 LysM peptidoglycan-binding domain-containing protein [Limosilactobacillus agrestis]
MTKKRTHHSKNYQARGAFAGAVSALSLLAITTQTVNAEQLTVKAGDTIWGLAKQHGLSVSALEQANPSVKKLNDSVDLITVGQQLTLPTIQHDTSADLNADGSYTVKAGDTLSSIADRYNVTVSQLMVWNNLSTGDSLYIGQRLSVTGPSISTTNTSIHQPVAQSTDTTSTAQVQASAVTAISVPQQDTTSNQTIPQETPASSAAQQVSTASTVATPSQSATNSSAAIVNNATSTSSVVTAATPVNSAATTTGVVQSAAANNVQATSTAALYGQQSFGQTAPVASQASQSQTAPASQATVAVQNNVATPQTQQPQQSQAAVSQPAQQATTTASQDLQHGSVVSLATKIANSNSVPYVWGGESLSGMDCSGLVKYVYANAEGKQLPHYTGALENCVDQHPVSEAKPGDLLFWGNHGSTYHTAIYTGNNQYVAAAKPGTNVATYTISPYFNPSFAGTVK